MVTAAAPAVDTGIAEQNKQDIAEDLCALLADTYVLYVKTQNFHWNVTGPAFHSLHKMFEAQYKDLAEAADLIAERVRALGQPAPGSFSEFSELATLRESRGIVRAEDMVGILEDDHETVTRKIRSCMLKTEQAGDHGSADLMTQRLLAHEKASWMLRSLAARAADEATLGRR